MSIFTKFVELDNAEKITKKQPITNLYDMYFHISRQNTPNAVIGTSVFDAFLKINKYNVPDENPQNTLLLHGDVFNSILKVYKQYLKNYDTSKLVFISKDEYKSLPKKYRGIFTPYDKDSYILNTYQNNMVITISAGQQERVASIIKEIERLLPIIYRTKQRTPDIDFGGFKIYEGNEPMVQPAFVKNTVSANFIDDNRFYAYKQLHDLFVELSQITMPRITNQQTKNKTDGAWAIYNEYKNELTRKNSVLLTNISDKIELQKTEQLIYAPTPKISLRETKKLIKKHQICTSPKNIAKWEYNIYNRNRKKLLQNLKQIISMKIK